jgi:hypothetical protein
VKESRSNPEKQQRENETGMKMGWDKPVFRVGEYGRKNG